MSFQGLTVNLSEPAHQPLQWWDVALTSLSDNDRRLVYAAKRAAGDTHVHLAISWNYENDGGFSYPIAGRDLAVMLPAFRNYVEEAIRQGFYVLIMCAGDGEGAGPGHNDPVGWTYGKTWLVANFARIYKSLADLSPYIIWVPGFDGVVPGWQPPQSVDPVLLYMRSVIGSTGYLGLELSAGYASWGDGGSNWNSPAGAAVDVILCEFPGPPTGDQVWQIAGRLLGPAYRRPSDQPAWDDPNPPYYLIKGTPRGPYSVVAFEYDLFRWVRKAVTHEQIVKEREYLKSLGFRNVC